MDYRKKKEQLRLIKESGHKFEKWFQLEVALSLKQNKSPEVYLEKFEKLSQTKKCPTRCSKNYGCQIDITYRRPNEKKNVYSGLELKEGKSFAAVKQSVEDLLKVKAIVGSRWNFRDFAFVLIYPSPAEPRRQKKEFQKFMEGLRRRPDFFHWKLTVGQPSWEVLALIWETSLPIRSEGSYFSREYCKWANSIHKLVNHTLSVPPETIRLRDGKS